MALTVVNQTTAHRYSRYRADIDGLRSVAIVPVLLYHAGIGLTGGFVGVDVFFVISGFLITNVVQWEIDSGEFSIVRFWERRVRRLFPALAVVLAATVVAGAVVLLPRDFRELGQSVVAQAVLAANFYFWREAGYFAGPSEIKPLLHTWSLAVEEQFYVMLPPILYLLRRTRLRVAVLAALFAASLAWCASSTTRTPEAAFFLLPSRAWELLLGVLLAFGYSRLAMPRGLREVLSVAGLMLIGWSCMRFNSGTAFPGLAATLPCIGAGLTIATGGRESPTLVERLLSTRPFVVIGLLSYSIYLWHWPLFAYANYLRFGPLSVSLKLALIAASVLIAAVSWYFVEQPFRRRTVCPTRRAAFVWYGCVTCSMLVVGLIVHTQNGLPQRFSAAVVTAAAGERDTNPQRRLRHDLPIAAIRSSLPRLGNLEDARPPILAVIGDSHGDAIMPLLDKLCREFDVPAIGVSRSATIPLFCGDTELNTGKRAFQNEVRRQLKASSSIHHVLLVSRWAEHTVNVMNRENLVRTTSELASSGKKVWLLRQVPEQRTSVPRAVALSLQWERDLTKAACTWEEYCEHQSRIDAMFDSLEGNGIQILDPSVELFPDHNVCRISNEGRPMYVDDDHLSVCGALQLRSVVSPIFAEMLRDRDLSTAMK